MVPKSMYFAITSGPIKTTVNIAMQSCCVVSFTDLVSFTKGTKVESVVDFT